jgi:heat-inducible transcriptional repressor
VLDERKLAVLRAIVEDYVATDEPVGSRTIVERHHLGVSPATVRNDMAALEDEGYIAQPHTSAGRVPTEAGYRLFVDRLAHVKPLSRAEQRAIEAFLEGAVDLDDVLTRGVRLLAQLTRQVAVVQYPSLQRAQIRHVELVAVSANRVVVVVITSSGRVHQHLVELPGDVDDDLLATLRQRVNEAVVGQPAADLTERAEQLLDSVPDSHRPAAAAVVAALLEVLVDEREQRIVLAGTGNLASLATTFPESLGPVLEALEEQVVLLRLMHEAARSTPDVTVLIGHEVPVRELSPTSVVGTSYAGDAGRLGVVGPTRMDYPGAIGTVRAVAAYLSRVLEESP